jgi:hypothetical protein
MPTLSTAPAVPPRIASTSAARFSPGRTCRPGAPMIACRDCRQPFAPALPNALSCDSCAASWRAKAARQSRRSPLDYVPATQRRVIRERVRR